MKHYREDLLREVLKRLVPESMRLFMYSSKLKEKCDKVEKYYKIHYSQEPFSKEMLELMKNPNPVN